MCPDALLMSVFQPNFYLRVGLYTLLTTRFSTKLLFTGRPIYEPTLSTRLFFLRVWLLD